MKNKIVNYILILIAGGTFASCNKVIEKDPTHTIDGDKFFTKIEDYDLSLVGAYQRLKQNSMYAGVNGGSIFLAAPDVAADNFYSGADNLGALITFFRWNYTSNTAEPQGGWNAAYNVIQQANVTVRGIDNFRADNNGAVNRIKGQAVALRAFMHFELLRWWCNSYDRNSTDLGIAYVDTFNIELMPSRGTVKTTYDKIEADLKAAHAMLSNVDAPIQSISSTAGANRAYIDSLVVDAMLARMYTYSNQPDSAIKYSSRVIAARPLANTTQFPLVFQDALTNEVVWSIKFESPNAALAREIYESAGNKVSWRPVTALLNLYSGSDVRATTYFTNITGRVVLTKYHAKSTAVGKPDGIVDFKILRTGEMYLIRAEALAKKGGQDVAALADLNALRTARGAAIGNEAGPALLTAIQTERRKELVAEGHRFFDLKRTTRVISRTQSCGSYCTLPSNSRAWNLPIPQDEILANPNMEQNPGY